MVTNDNENPAKTLGDVWHELQHKVRASADCSSASQEELDRSLHAMRTTMALGADVVFSQLLAEIRRMPVQVRAIVMTALGPIRGQFEAFRDEAKREHERLSDPKIVR